MTITDFLIIITVLLIINLLVSLASTFVSVRASRRELGERIVDKPVHHNHYVENIFPDKKPLDMDAHMIAMLAHIEKHGVKGSPDALHEMMKLIYGEDYSRYWIRSKGNIYRYEPVEDND